MQKVEIRLFYDKLKCFLILNQSIFLSYWQNYIIFFVHIDFKNNIRREKTDFMENE